MSKSICIFNRPDADRFPGGDTVQIRAIQLFLQSRGHRVTVISDWQAMLEAFDLIFLFNLTRPIEAYLQAQQAIKFRKPYVVFPVYWDLDALPMRSGWRGRVKRWLPERVKDWGRLYKFNKRYATNSPVSFMKASAQAMISEVMDQAAFICPNSEAEKDHLIEKFQLKASIQAKIRVIYNGLHTDMLEQAIVPAELRLPEFFVCCVGGIGPRKNQLQLIEAARLTNIPIVLVGKAAPGDERYYQQVAANIGPLVTIIKNVPQSAVFHIMRQSVGHIQPSYIETPGLASLEAGALGCSIGVSDVGPVREYFGDYAHYCLPDNVESIALCLKQLAYQSSDSQLSSYIKEKFDWNNVLIPLDHLIRYIEE